MSGHPESSPHTLSIDSIARRNLLKKLVGAQELLLQTKAFNYGYLAEMRTKSHQQASVVAAVFDIPSTPPAGDEANQSIPTNPSWLLFIYQDNTPQGYRSLILAKHSLFRVRIDTYSKVRLRPSDQIVVWSFP